jgi:hypothetical protein
MPKPALVGERHHTFGDAPCLRRPERARVRIGTPWTPQSVDVRRRPRTPLALSLLQRAPLDDNNPPDTLPCPREHHSHRHRHRVSATATQYTTCPRPIFAPSHSAVAARRSARNRSTVPRPHLAPSLTGITAPWSTRVHTRSTSRRYKRRATLDDFFTLSCSPLTSSPPRPLPLFDYPPARRNLAGDHRSRGQIETEFATTSGAPTTTADLALVDNPVLPRRRSSPELR